MSGCTVLCPYREMPNCLTTMHQGPCRLPHGETYPYSLALFPTRQPARDGRGDACAVALHA